MPPACCVGAVDLLNVDSLPANLSADVWKPILCAAKRLVRGAAAAATREKFLRADIVFGGLEVEVVFRDEVEECE